MDGTAPVVQMTLRQRLLDGTAYTILDWSRHQDSITDDEYHKRRERYLRGREGYTFSTDEDIVRMVDALSTGAKDANVFPVTYIADPRRMIQLGLWPTSIEMDGGWVLEWLAGVPNKEIRFWHGLAGSERNAAMLHEEMNWQYKTLQTIKREAIQGANSIALSLYAPELLYRGSHRPINDMSLFRSPMSVTTRREDVINSVIVIQGEQWNVVPVTRYALGMSKGLYYDVDTPSEVCGTFYYQEEESTTLLAYKTALRAFNKTDAAAKLSVPRDYRTVDIASEMAAHIDGTLPRDLMMTPLEAFAYSRHGGIDPASLSQAKHYAGAFLGLYAAEDAWDQPLCNAAREAGYDVVILEAMVGSFQIVTEVLDTRTRENSFQSLVYITG